MRDATALVVFSGGQDSTTCLGWALSEYKEVRLLTIDYGQRHHREILAANEVRQFFEMETGRTIPHEVLGVGSILEGTSPLTNPASELETYQDHRQMEEVIGDRIEKTFVPMRNGLFFMIAGNRASVHGCSAIVTGVCEADNANYPDCKALFVQNCEIAINNGLGIYPYGDEAIRIKTPLMNRSKAATVSLALNLPYTYAALAYSHTAYDGNYPPVSKDHASVLRAYGFEQAGVPDPLVVRAWSEGLMELPETRNYNTRAMTWARDHLSFPGFSFPGFGSDAP